MRVLVVDDDASSAALLEAGLGRHGWEVVTAADGVEGLATAQAGHFDVIVSDILMPRMDGFRFCQAVRAQPELCEIPFVFYTATYTAPEDEEFALSIGADGFIVKPSNPEDLVALVEPLVRLQASSQARRNSCNEPVDGTEVLRRYSERLVRKLEDKVLQLENRNAEVQRALETLADEVGVKHELIERFGRPDGEEAFDIAAIEAVPQLIQDGPIALIVSDPTGRPVRWNLAAEEILGFEGGLARPAAIVQSADPDELHLGDALKRVSSGETFHGVEIAYDSDGSSKHKLLFVGGPVRRQGEIVGGLSVIVDSGGTLEAESELEGQKEQLESLVETRTAELVRANARLEEAAKAKSSFLAGMGHAMRNQLNSIIGFSGILLQGLGGELTAEQRRQIDMIYVSGQRQLALVNDVVDLSKIEAGQLEMRVGPFELLGFLDKIVASFEAQAAESGISLSLEAPGGVIPMHSDAGKVEHVVRNLLSNALKFTSKGGVTLGVETADDGTSAVIRVRDSGEGIPLEVMSRVFDEFVKFDPRLGTAGEGTGLGLALTRRYCEMLGGSVSARSNPGEGSVFTVVLPLDISSPAGAAEDPSEGDDG